MRTLKLVLFGALVTGAALVSEHRQARAQAENDGNEERAAGRPAWLLDPRRRDLPEDYQSGSVPFEDPAVVRRLEVASSHMERKDWAAALAVLDQLLGEVTSPEEARRRRDRAILLEKEFEEEAESDADAGAGAVQVQALEGGLAGGAAGPGGGKPEEARISDDPISPTVSVFSRDGIRFLPLVDAIREWLLDLPADARSLYGRTYGGPAERGLEAARSQGGAARMEALERVADRYALTDAGRVARAELAVRLADAGRLAEAARETDLLLEIGVRGGASADAATRAQSAYYHLLAGELDSGRAALARVASEHSEVAVPVRGIARLGAELPESELFRELVARAEVARTPPSPWPAPQGGYDRVMPPLSVDAPPRAGAELRWYYELEAPPEPKPGTRGAVTATTTAVQVVRWGGFLCLRRPGEILGIDASNGNVKWRSSFDPLDLSARRVSSASGPLDVAGLSLTVFRPADLQPGADVAHVGFVDNAPVITFDQKQGFRYSPNELVAVEADSGKIVWRLRGESGERRTVLTGMSFAGPPIPAGDVLVAPAYRQGGFYLIGIDARQGGAELRWITRLYSFNLNYFRQYGFRSGAAALLAARDGIVYSMPSDGVLTAVRANDGALLWISRYRSSSRTGQGLSHARPAIVGDAKAPILLASPGDSERLVAVDARSGRLLRQNRKQGATWVGTDGKTLYVALGGKLEAIDVASGEARWESESDTRASGIGFIGAGRVYIPGLDGRITVVSASDGSKIARYLVIDPRVPHIYPFNLFPLGESVVIATPFGLGLLRPQEEAWEALAEEEAAKDAENVFRRLRLLRGAGRHEEALDLLFELEARYRDRSVLHESITERLLATVEEAVAEKKDPSFLRRLLDCDPPIVTDAETRIELRLREAVLTAARDRARSVPLWISLAKARGRLADGPDGTRVDVGVYAAECLRDLFQGRWLEDGTLTGRLLATNDEGDAETEGEDDGAPASDTAGDSEDESDGEDGEVATRGGEGDVDDGDGDEDEDAAAEGAASAESAPKREPVEPLVASLEEAIERWPALAEEAEIAARQIEGAPSDRDLLRVVTWRPHTPAAAEAAAILAARARDRGRESVFQHHLRRLVDDYPVFRDVPEIADAISKSSAPREGEPEAQGAWRALPPSEGEWVEGFWKDTEEGIGFQSAAGSEPLPAIFALKGPKLRAYDAAGDLIIERELPGFPDLEEVKLRLSSEIEEPAIADYRDGHLVIGTAAGCYGFRVRDPRPASTGGDDAERVNEVLDPTAFRFEWSVTYPHPLETYQSSSRSFWGTLRISANGNIFPWIGFADNGDPIVLSPDAELVRIDRRCGKRLFRFNPGSYSVAGSPRVTPTAWEVATTEPAGVLRYPIEGGVRREGSPVFLPGEKGSAGGWFVDGIATVFASGNGTDVRFDVGGRKLWERKSGSTPIHATPTEVWTTSYGNLKARSLRTGRMRWSVDLPQQTRVVAIFDDPAEKPGADLTLVTSAALWNRSMSYVRLASVQGSSATGSRLHVVGLSKDRRITWKRRIANGRVSYNGDRIVTASGDWLLAFNEQPEKQDKWFTRVVLFSPMTHEVRAIVRTELSSKGTGLPPRVATVAGGLGIANADGFGWFEPPPAPGEDPKESEGGDGRTEPERAGGEDPPASSPPARSEAPAASAR